MSVRATSGKSRDYPVAFNLAASQTPGMQLVVSTLPLVGSKAV
jgi:hypothetical protein